METLSSAVDRPTRAAPRARQKSAAQGAGTARRPTIWLLTAPTNAWLQKRSIKKSCKVSKSSRTSVYAQPGRLMRATPSRAHLAEKSNQPYQAEDNNVPDRSKYRSFTALMPELPIRHFAFRLQGSISLALTDQKVRPNADMKRPGAILEVTPTWKNEAR